METNVCHVMKLWKSFQKNWTVSCCAKGTWFSKGAQCAPRATGAPKKSGLDRAKRQTLQPSFASSQPNRGNCLQSVVEGVFRLVGGPVESFIFFYPKDSRGYVNGLSKCMSKSMSGSHKALWITSILSLHQLFQQFLSQLEKTQVLNAGCQTSTSSVSLCCLYNQVERATGLYSWSVFEECYRIFAHDHTN